MTDHGWAVQDIHKHEYKNINNLTTMNALKSDYDLSKQRREAVNNQSKHIQLKLQMNLSKPPFSSHICKNTDASSLTSLTNKTNKIVCWCWQPSLGSFNTIFSTKSNFSITPFPLYSTLSQYYQFFLTMIIVSPFLNGFHTRIYIKMFTQNVATIKQCNYKCVRQT